MPSSRQFRCRFRAVRGGHWGELRLRVYGFGAQAVGARDGCFDDHTSNLVINSTSCSELSSLMDTIGNIDTTRVAQQSQ